MSWIAAGIALAGTAASIGSQFAKGGAKTGLAAAGSGMTTGGAMGMGVQGGGKTTAEKVAQQAPAFQVPAASSQPAPQVAMPRNMIAPPTGTDDDDTVAERFNDIYKRGLDEEMLRQRNPIRTYGLYD